MGRMKECVDRDRLPFLRMAVFCAALRTKDNFRNGADENARWAWLVRELEGMGLEVRKFGAHEMELAGLVLVRSGAGMAGETEKEAMREALEKRGLAMGVLVDFERDLMMDGLVMVDSDGNHAAAGLA